MSNKSINVDQIIENDDGTATLTISMDDSTRDILLRAGLRLLIPDDCKGKVLVLEPLEVPKNTKSVELADEEINYLIEIAVIDALKNFIKKNGE